MKFDATKIIILVALAVVIGVPFLFKPKEATPDPNALRLIIITPHNEQIRYEFERGFDRWYRKSFDDQGVVIDWRTPGGTSEIRKQLVSEYGAANKRGPIQPKSMSYDLLFGGGSYEHGKMKTTVFKDSRVGEKDVEPIEWSTSISEPVYFTDDELYTWFGKNEIGRNTLYDPDHHWFGAALSAFGIVFNRDVLRDLGVDDLQTWSDLGHPNLQGWVALADPGQSGSICTTFEVILQRKGWNDGWRTLQEAAANSRYYSNSSSKVPIDVSLGEAAAGMCIDFYGRFQSQSIKDAGGGDRVGYADPPKMSDIDPDPVSMLVGAPHPDLAKQFIRYCLSEEGQSLWQYSASPKDANETSLGPERYELRRMPSRRIMYEATHFDHFVDAVNPFELAEPIDSWDRDVRTFIAPMFSAIAIDNHENLQRAWRAIHTVAEDHPNRASALNLFYARPTATVADPTTGEELTVSLETKEHIKLIKAGWKKDPQKKVRDRIAWTTFYRDHYKKIVRLLAE